MALVRFLTPSVVLLCSIPAWFFGLSLLVLRLCYHHSSAYQLLDGMCTLSATGKLLILSRWRINLQAQNFMFQSLDFTGFLFKSFVSDLKLKLLLNTHFYHTKVAEKHAKMSVYINNLVYVA